jgi:prepilin-type N-terminal cleavage/methylation domain-containing protein
MIRRRAFTLIETLAAVALLAALAAAVVPLALKLGQGQLIITDQMQAMELLRGLKRADLPEALTGTVPLKKHAAWFARCTPLAPGPRPVRPSGSTPPAHRWIHLAIASGPDATATVLADGLMLVSDGAEPAP